MSRIEADGNDVGKTIRSRIRFGLIERHGQKNATKEEVNA
jgi:hypothetical protein